MSWLPPCLRRSVWRTSSWPLRPDGPVWLPVAALARRRFAVYFHGYDVGAVLHKDPDAYADLFGSGAALLTNSEYLKNRLVDAGATEERVAVVRLGVHPGWPGRPAAGLRSGGS
jgi:hypothetical protein